MSVDTNNTLNIHNGKEKITLRLTKIINDSLFYHFYEFNTYLVLNVLNNGKISGLWVNNNRSFSNKIPFFAHYNNEKNKSTFKSDIKLNNRWKVKFSYDKLSAYPAIGVFNQNEDNSISGTFMTETGDYRFLEGKIEKNKLTLSCFDGAHAFLFEANYKNDSLKGVFYSGSHWQTKWYGVPDDTFNLKNPDSITFLMNDKKISFNKPKLDQSILKYPSKDLENKVVIIQIFGSWCPNCMDETLFFNDLYKKYNNQGLEIIAIGYETSSELKEQINRLQAYKDKLNINYTLLVGGKANKTIASEDFPMLNNISSFPTSIFINKKGEVIKIHTGFNGPGTDDIYTDYVEKTSVFIEQLLSE